ncbi:MAG: hypothetical protein KAJ33_07330, partial [Thermoplasmata archaeon]|nr:hypothetical protein [Thermoplasmata archaeon]
CENILKTLDNNIVLMDSYYRFGLAHKKSNYLDEASTFFNEALALSKKLKDDAASRQIIEEINQLKK